MADTDPNDDVDQTAPADAAPETTEPNDGGDDAAPETTEPNDGGDDAAPETTEPNDDGDVTPRGTMTPKEDFDQTKRKETESGNEVVNEKATKSGTVVEFSDGGKLRMLTSGHMVYDKADGSKFQRNPDGTGIEITSAGKKIQENPNGNIIVQDMSGTEVTHVALTGQKIYKYRDGTVKQLNPDGTGVTVDEDGNQDEFGPGGDAEFDEERAANDKKPLDEADENSDPTPKGTMSPKEDFDQTVRKETESGNKIKKRGRKPSGAVIEFDDGSMLRLLTTGHMVYDRADGSKFQRNPDGTGIEITADGKKIQENPNGNIIVQDMSGTEVTHVALTGQKIYKYQDGTTKQVDADGSGVILDEEGTQTPFEDGEDAEFDQQREDKDVQDKAPMGADEENDDTEEQEDSEDEQNDYDEEGAEAAEAASTGDGDATENPVDGEEDSPAKSGEDGESEVKSGEDGEEGGESSAKNSEDGESSAKNSEDGEDDVESEDGEDYTESEAKNEDDSDVTTDRHCDDCNSGNRRRSHICRSDGNQRCCEVCVVM